MLSISAFNALLKTLEEPPERVIFVLATTAPHKVPVTIRSRCQHIPFHGMTLEQIVNRLKQVSEAERIDARDEALWEIARNSEGGMRDALSLMEQAIALGAGSVTRETVDKLLGGGSSSSIRQWLSGSHATPENSLPILEGLFRSGAEPNVSCRCCLRACGIYGCKSAGERRSCAHWRFRKKSVNGWRRRKIFCLSAP